MNSASITNNLPSYPTKLFGRERYLSSTTAYIKNSVASTVVNIYGPPGIGKSELAIHVGIHLLKEGSHVYYIDLNKTDSIFSLNDKLSSYLREPEQIQLLILDNADHYWSSEKLMSVLSKYVNKLNILITSRKQVTFTHEVNSKSIPLNKLTANDCISLIVSELACLRKYANQICLQFNNIPQAVLLAIGPIKHNQIWAISQELLSDYQNQQLNLFMPFGQSINGSASFIAAAFLWNIKNLVSDCHWYLVQSDSVDGSSLDELVLSDQGNKWEYCIKEFIGQSLLLIDEDKQYHFKPYTKELVNLLKNGSQIIQVKTHTGTVGFWERFSTYYMDTLVHLLEDTDDLELAIKIGSNQNIANSLLPLLSKSFDVTPLLQCASRIIEVQCSNPSFHTTLNASDMIYAIGYLHKALYCPAVNTIRLLRDPNYKSGSACRQCLEKIRSCLWLVDTLHEQAAGNTAAMEAHAFYYRLFGTNAKICEHQWDYSGHLIDLANIVSFAKRKYESKFQNSKVITDIEVGLETYSHMRIAETRRLMQSVLKQTFENDQCNFAIKVIAIMVLHTLHLSEQFEEDFNDIVSLHKHFFFTIDTLSANTTCFASTYHELFIPFLKSVGQNTSKLEQSQEDLEHFFNKTCNAQNLWVGHCYRKRYDLSHGTFLFTADELTAEVSRVFSRLQEPLLCSLLRDIALDCPSPFPPPELVTSAREARTKRLIEDLKPLFPDPSSFAQVVNSFQQKTVAHQYYSL